MSKKSSNKNQSTSQSAPPPPKRPLTGYLRWTLDVRESFKKKNPALNAKELISLLGEEWRKQPNTVKKKFEELYEKDKKRFEEEMKAYTAKYGPVISHKKKAPQRNGDKKKKTKKSSRDEDDDDE